MSRSNDRGSALVEAAIVLPCLILLLHWSISLTELLLVRIKATEAARRALWETTVSKAPPFVDESGSGLWTSPRLRFRTSFEMRSTALPAASVLNPAEFSIPNSPALGMLRHSFAEAARRFGFRDGGVAAVRVHLEDVPYPPWLRSAAVPAASAAPMQLVFDTWRAWPAEGADPARTYGVVERQVGEHVSAIAFSGLRGSALFNRIAGAFDGAFASQTMRTALGGRPPDVFATGPFSILPPAPPDAAFVPNTCDDARGACANTRAGDVLSSERPDRLGGAEAFSDGEDSPRATVPFRIHGRYWTRSGGSDGDRRAATQPYPERLAERNGYVASWACRGHFFAGSVVAEEADVRKRYRGSCR